MAFPNETACPSDFDIAFSCDSNATDLPANNAFDSIYNLALEVEPGFVRLWTGGLPCIGLGTNDLVCSMHVPFATP
jgi:hypothetical protein